MLWPLIKKTMMDLNRGFFVDRKTGKKKSAKSTVISILFFAIIIFGVLGTMFFQMSMSFCETMVSAGLGWLYFLLMIIVAVVLGVIGSAFSCYSMLYEAKDNELLLAMPIPSSYILISRLISVYAMSLLYSSIVMVPTWLAHLLTFGFSLKVFIGCFMVILSVSLLDLTLSCVLGYGVAKLTRRMKHKNVLTTVFSLLFLALYYYFYFSFVNRLEELLSNLTTVSLGLRQRLSFVMFAGKAAEGDILSIVLLVGFTLVLFGLLFAVLSKSFIRIATSGHSVSRNGYRKTMTKSHGRSSALLRKEFKRYTASSTYMLNCTLGSVFLLMAAVYLLFKSNELLSVLSSEFMRDMDLGQMGMFMAIGIAVVTSMNTITAPSVSLEGKNLWIVQSLPVNPLDVLYAKVKLHLLLTCIPALFAGVCCGVVLSLPLPEFVMVIVFPQTFILFMALSGVGLNMLFPNVHWTNETIAVKQSMSVMVTMFGGMIAGVGLFFASMVLPFDAWIVLLLLSLLMLLLSGAWILYLKYKGAAKFRYLS